jgi:anti-anti-sigma factor
LVPVPMFVAPADRPARSARSAQMQPFELNVSELPPGCPRIEVQGDLDLAVTERLAEALAAATEHREVLVDLARCDFLDSSAIEALLEAERLLALEDRRLLVVGPRGQVLRVLTVMGLNDRGVVFASVAEALASSPAPVAA